MRQGAAGQGLVWRVKAGYGWNYFEVRRGGAGHGQARLGMFRLGRNYFLAGQGRVWRGLARCGGASRGWAGYGMFSRGMAQKETEGGEFRGPFYGLMNSPSSASTVIQHRQFPLHFVPIPGAICPVWASNSS